MKKKSTQQLLQRRKTLVRDLSSWQAQLLRGSLIERYKRCGKPGCKCANTPGHGPKFYLSVSLPGQRPEMDYISQDLEPKARVWLENFQELKQVLEEICNINRELLRRKEDL